ncbi:MAG: DUF1858 domain-containing protein [Lachnospiraceae bacterium]|nr:DUF1858 domain-containing protein [Lachnospiraceae bacterium]
MEDLRNELGEAALAQENEAAEDKTVITKDMVVGDILQMHPQAAFPLMNCGMGCISCPSALMETLEQACIVHGMDADEVTTYVNAELGLIEA